MTAYLDIETSWQRAITVIGIYRPDRGVIQLVGEGVTVENLRIALAGTRTVVTFNGNAFDLPVISRRLGVDLKQSHVSHDLMYDCWKRGLKGGLKQVEERLGIARASIGLDGRDAMRLWDTYQRRGDEAALHTLLTYNRDDIVNLPALAQALGVLLPPAADHIPWRVIRAPRPVLLAR